MNPAKKKQQIQEVWIELLFENVVFLFKKIHLVKFSLKKYVFVIFDKSECKFDVNLHLQV